VANVLFLFRRPPYAGSRSLEAIEAALVAGVFDQQVAALFKDDGVWQLLRDQDGAILGGRTVSKVASALPEYGIDAIYVCAKSLSRRGLKADDLVLAATPLDAQGQRELIAAQNAVLND